MKKRGLLVTLIFTIILYMETLFRVTVFDRFIDLNYINVMLFTATIALFLYFILVFLNPRYKKIFLITIVSILTLAYISQFVYYKVFAAIFSFNSLGEAILAVDFADFILRVMGNNWLQLVMFLVPLISLIIVIKKTQIMYLKHDYHREGLYTFGVFILVNILALTPIMLTKGDSSQNRYSEYNLYENINAPTITASKFGLLTMMRLDIQRIIFGINDDSFDFNPVVDDEGNQDDEDKDDSNDEEQPPVVIKDNILDIDWESIIANEDNETIKNMHEYFSKVTPTKENDYTGIFKGKNLIVFMGEAFHTVGIDPDLTPTLYKFAHEGIQLTKFYVPLNYCGTSNGEFAGALGIVPYANKCTFKETYENYFPFSLGHIFGDLGYKTRAYHNHTYSYYDRHLSHPNMGYEYIGCGNGLEKKMSCSSWPNSDLEMIKGTTADYINNSPFMTYYVTVSGHLNYTYGGNAMVKKNWDQVKDLDYSDLVKGYLSTHIELDHAMEQLLKDLEAAGELENTVIAMYADHWPYGLDANRLDKSKGVSLDLLNENSSYERTNTFERDHSTLVLWNSEIEPITIDKPASSIDVLPTLLNLFGVDYDSRLLMGRDIMSEAEPLVIYPNNSWVTEKGTYDILKKKSNPFTEQTITDDYINRINNIVYNRSYMSKLILDNDYYRKLFDAIEEVNQE